MVALLVQFHLFCLSVLWIQGAAAQEVDAMREAQLPALSVGFKVHQQGLRGSNVGAMHEGKQKCQDTHRASI